MWRCSAAACLLRDVHTSTALWCNNIEKCLAQAIKTAEAELERSPQPWTGNDGKGFRVTCESIPLDLSSLSPAKVGPMLFKIGLNASICHEPYLMRNNTHSTCQDIPHKPCQGYINQVCQIAALRTRVYTWKLSPCEPSAHIMVAGCIYLCSSNALGQAQVRHLNSLSVISRR